VRRLFAEIGLIWMLCTCAPPLATEPWFIYIVRTSIWLLLEEREPFGTNYVELLPRTALPDALAAVFIT